MLSSVPHAELILTRLRDKDVKTLREKFESSFAKRQIAGEAKFTRCGAAVQDANIHAWRTASAASCSAG